jgi:hypothetical protein
MSDDAAPDLYAGPWVQAALVCDRWLVEGDGVISLIRIVDQVNVNAGQDAPPELPEISIQFRVAVMLKAGEARGRHRVELVVELPSGQSLGAQGGDVHFTGEERGVNMLIEMQAPAVEGLYWIDVLVNSRRLTRIPLRVNYAQMQPGAAG